MSTNINQAPRWTRAQCHFVCSANQNYKLSWGENCPGGIYPAQTNVPEEVKKAFAARGTDDKYDSLKRMLDGMLAADAGERWKLEQVMVREQ